MIAGEVRMGEAARKLKLGYEEYLALERETYLRHEFLDGEAWAMAGGTPRHAKVMTNLSALTWAALRGRRCQPYNSELKIQIENTGLTTYPDVAVICGPLVRSPQDRNAVTNPTLLAEVLSPSTEGWDRGGKFAHYQHIPTLRYYLLVNVDRVRVELFTRESEGRWTLTVHGPGTQVPLPDLEISIDVDELYADLPEEPVEEKRAPHQEKM
jgi:Uma2 family endonuclease